jgi:hypothetical protein
MDRSPSFLETKKPENSAAYAEFAAGEYADRAGLFRESRQAGAFLGWLR